MDKARWSSLPMPRLPGAGWRDLLKEKELRVVSLEPGTGRPYAVTTIALEGDVLVQIDRGWWLETPATFRAAALAAHGTRVIEAVEALGSPASLISFLALPVRG